MSRRAKKTVRDLERHFEKRLRERYGLSIKAAAVSEMIRAGQSTPVFAESLARKHHAVTIEGKEVRVVYNTALNSVVTALP